MKYVGATVPTTVSLALTLLVGCNDSTPSTDLERAIASLPPSVMPAFDPDVLRSRGGDPPPPAPDDGTPPVIALPGSTPLPTRRPAPIRVLAQPAATAADPDEGQPGTPADGADPPRGLAGLFRRGVDAVSNITALIPIPGVTPTPPGGAGGAPPAGDTMTPEPQTATPSPSAAPDPLLGRKVQSLLRTKCFGCHSNRARRLRGEFNMEAPDALAKGGESGQPAVVPGEPGQSPLYRAVTWQDPDFRMPPRQRDRLTPAQVEDIRQWIAAGAPLQ